MRSTWFGSALAALVLIAAPAIAADRVTLAVDPMTMLRQVATYMNVTLRDDVPPPVVLLESETPLARFQAAIAGQWGFRPNVFANAYVVSRNEIYLVDDASYYRRLRRTLDESLAHELAHYVQVRYFHADLSDASSEIDAIAVQQHFRLDAAQ